MAKSYHLKEIVDYENGRSSTAVETYRDETKAWHFSSDSKPLDETAIWKTALQVSFNKPVKIKENS